jgi:hypothetical protein
MTTAKELLQMDISHILFIKKCRDFSLQIHMAFIDIKKSFHGSHQKHTI